MFLALSCISLSQARGEDITLQCRFFTNADGDYVCQAEGLRVFRSNSRITQVTGRHMSGKSNADVTSFNIAFQETKYLPMGFMSFFPNLRTFFVNSSGLKFFTKEDMRDATNLRKIFVNFNDVEELASDTFEGFNKLETFEMHDNKLRMIGAGIFDSISSLKFVNFRKNSCINKYYPRDMGFDEMKQEIRQKCAGGRNFIRKMNKDMDYSSESTGRW